MAAYGALVSLTHIVEQIQHHPSPPITLDQEQAHLLLENAAFLQHFLEDYPNVVNTNEADRLKSRIRVVASVTQEIISRRIQSIHGASTSQGEATSSVDLYRYLQKILEHLKSIVIEVKEIIQNADSSRSTDHADSSSSSSSSSSVLVGVEAAVLEITDKLTGELPSNLMVIPIVGMGGIGKTTLAKTIYETPFIIQHFDIRVWVSISVDFNVQEFFLQILEFLSTSKTEEVLSEHELGIKVYQSLWNRRYLIVLDDIWKFEAWENVSSFFPDNGNGSRIMITTRLSNVASKFTNSYVHNMSFLDEEKSLDLFCKHVLREKDNTLGELEDLGKEIARECGGLPLSIVVIGGLLAKSPKTIGYWEFILVFLSSAVNLTDNERYHQIMDVSYNQLLVHLKPCFLYFAIFPQNNMIRASRLIKLWVSEGFLRPVNGKRLEIVAEEYLQELIDRNLIIVRKLASDGKIKFCKIHDFLRDLSLRKALKEDFLGMATRYGFGIYESVAEWDYNDTMSLYRPIVAVAKPKPEYSFIDPILGSLLISWQLRSISKTVKREGKESNSLKEDIVNLRYLAMFGSQVQPFSRSPSSLYLLWNLQTLIVDSAELSAPVEIWKMPQLRHIMFSGLHLPDPPQDDNGVVLEKLQTLSEVSSFKLSEEVVRRIPNLKKLKVSYCFKSQEFEEVDYCINNIGCLKQLESLSCSFFPFEDNRDYLLQNLIFPQSLKKLSLAGRTFLQWDDMNSVIGSLPNLQVLKLSLCAFVGAVWETVEGQFCSLKYLVIDTCFDLEFWFTESSHFPCLEHIVLRDMERLTEIPSDMGYIPTLRSIELDRCADSAVLSTKKLLEEQEEFDNEDIQIRVKLWKKDEQLLSLASRNFLIRV